MRPHLAVIVAAIVTLNMFAVGEARSQDQRPTRMFTSRQDVVRLDVLVSRGGKPVLGLKPEDFRIKDNGVRQEAEFLSFDEVPLNVILTFDVSGSMSGDRLRDLREAGRALIAQLRKGDRGALITFSHAASVRVDLTADTGILTEALDRTGAVGQTSLVDASLAGLTLSGSEIGRSLVLVFSDGLDTSSWLEPGAVIDAARRVNAVVFAVTLGKRAPFLKDLTEATGGDVVEVKATSDLRPTFLRILSEYRQRYVVGYTPTGVSATGYHKLEVAVAGGGITVKARPGYQGN
jgi:VWFA-related protein